MRMNIKILIKSMHDQVAVHVISQMRKMNEAFCVVGINAVQMLASVLRTLRPRCQTDKKQRTKYKTKLKRTEPCQTKYQIKYTANEIA